MKSALALAAFFMQVCRKGYHFSDLQVFLFSRQHLPAAPEPPGMMYLTMPLPPFNQLPLSDALRQLD